MKSALHSRDGWFELLEQVKAEHLEVERGKCQGGLEYPCPTERVLRGDRGRYQRLRDATTRMNLGDHLLGDYDDGGEPQ